MTPLTDAQLDALVARLWAADSSMSTDDLRRVARVLDRHADEIDHQEELAEDARLQAEVRH